MGLADGGVRFPDVVSRPLIVVGSCRRGPDAGTRRQAASTPVFRAGVELVSIDVTALDANGRQVIDLTAGEFQVEIDGDRRLVSTVEYVRSADPLRQIGAPHHVVVADETFSTLQCQGLRHAAG